jgi:hypothetical protein
MQQFHGSPPQVQFTTLHLHGTEPSAIQPEWFMSRLEIERNKGGERKRAAAFFMTYG